MNLVQYDPFFSVFPRRTKTLADLFLTEACANGACASWNPAVDIHEEEKQFVVTADIPGVNPKDVEITFENGVLTITGERKAESKTEGKNYRRTERTLGTFTRKFAFPETVDAEHVTAKGKDGVLEIIVPKKEAVLPRKIQVQ